MILKKSLWTNFIFNSSLCKYFISTTQYNSSACAYAFVCVSLLMLVHSTTIEIEEFRFKSGLSGLSGVYYSSYHSDIVTLIVH